MKHPLSKALEDLREYFFEEKELLWIYEIADSLNKNKSSPVLIDYICQHNRRLFALLFLESELMEEEAHRILNYLGDFSGDEEILKEEILFAYWIKYVFPELGELFKKRNICINSIGHRTALIVRRFNHTQSSRLLNFVSNLFDRKEGFFLADISVTCNWLTSSLDLTFLIQEIYPNLSNLSMYSYDPNYHVREEIGLSYPFPKENYINTALALKEINTKLIREFSLFDPDKILPDPFTWNKPGREG